MTEIDRLDTEGPPRLLTAAGIGYAYPSGTVALRDISFDVRSGEVLSVIGPSGCGKSTLLSIIAAIQPAYTGQLHWHRESSPANGDGPKLSLMFQKDTLLPWMTVEKNIRFPLRFTKLSKQDRAERVEFLLTLGNLGEFRGAQPRQLSGGMRRKLSLLVGIAAFPSLLLLDEPFSALDEPTRVALHAELLPILRELNVTTVLVTHDLAEAITLGDRVLRLSQRPATVEQIYDIGLGRDRDVLAARHEPRYQSIYAEIWGDLYDDPRSAPAKSSGPRSIRGKSA